MLTDHVLSVFLCTCFFVSLRKWYFHGIIRLCFYIKDVIRMAENKYKFERLTPTDNVDLEVYEEAIDYVFDNPDVRNVAISGAYSAGKSSILASYKKSIVIRGFCIFHLHIFNLQTRKKMQQR